MSCWHHPNTIVPKTLHALFRGGFLNVEPSRKRRLRPRSGVVADSPLRPLVHLSQISGPVRSFFPVFARSWGFPVAYRAAVGSSGCAGRLGCAGLGCLGRAKADSGGYCRCCGVRAVCLVGRRPCGEAVGEDVSAGRMVTLGPGRSGGFLGLGSFDPEGLFEVVSDG